LVTLLVATRYGLGPIRFWFDTGADLTTLPVPLARDRGIEFTVSEATRGTTTGLVGETTRYRGAIRLLIAGEGFEWPCDFLVPPPSAPQGVAGNEYAILGRASFLAAFAACIDDRYFYLRRRFLERPGWYRLLRRLWPLFPKDHPPLDPL
jgi:hypothetical protein